MGGSKMLTRGFNLRTLWILGILGITKLAPWGCLLASYMQLIVKNICIAQDSIFYHLKVKKAACEESFVARTLYFDSVVCSN